MYSGMERKIWLKLVQKPDMMRRNNAKRQLLQCIRLRRKLRPCDEGSSTLDDKAEERLESLIFKDARARIIDFLKDSANKRGRRVGYEMLLKHCLTQQDIANITGTSRQTVTSVLNDLRKENLIYFNRRTILIRDMERLV